MGPDTMRQVERLVMGGPMMGFALDSDEVPLVKGSTCLLAAAPGELGPRRDPYPCIRCGECHEVCPAGLLPQQIYAFARERDLDGARDYKLFDCIECGCCDYVCPSHIPLVQYFRAAKTGYWAREAQRRQAELARRRHASGQERLEREQAERRARLEEKKRSLDERGARGEGAREELERIMQRARAKKRGEGEGEGE
jgi:Na+-translocating ferredoxin:NAD+ oxidoreductase subunit C